jgi:hypothetical protein
VRYWPCSAGIFEDQLRVAAAQFLLQLRERHLGSHTRTTQPRQQRIQWQGTAAADCVGDGMIFEQQHCPERHLTTQPQLCGTAKGGGKGDAPVGMPAIIPRLEAVAGG